jgi:hypothetical protein
MTVYAGTFLEPLRLGPREAVLAKRKGERRRAHTQDEQQIHEGFRRDHQIITGIRSARLPVLLRARVSRGSNAAAVHDKPSWPARRADISPTTPAPEIHTPFKVHQRRRGPCTCGLFVDACCLPPLGNSTRDTQGLACVCRNRGQEADAAGTHRPTLECFWKRWSGEVRAVDSPACAASGSPSRGWRFETLVARVAPEIRQCPIGGSRQNRERKLIIGGLLEKQQTKICRHWTGHSHVVRSTSYLSFRRNQGVARSVVMPARRTPPCRDEGIVGQTIDTPTLVSHCLLANFPCESRRDGLKRASGRGRPPVRNGNASRYFANTSRCHQGIACLAGHVPNSNHLDPLPATAASPRSLALPPRLACFLQRVVN